MHELDKELLFDLASELRTILSCSDETVSDSINDLATAIQFCAAAIDQNDPLLMKKALIMAASLLPEDSDFIDDIELRLAVG